MTKTAIIAFGLALLGPAFVQAAPADSVPTSERVSYRDLDLNNPRDAAVMLERLRQAALQACGASPFSIPEYRRSVEASACYRQSLERAVGELGSPSVGQLYQNASAVASN